MVHSLLLFSLTISAQQQPLSVGWELWYPYQYHNDKQQLVGLDFEIFNAIIKEANFSVNYTELPWKRHLHYIKTGVMDIAMGASMTKERNTYAYFSLPYRKETVKLYVKKGNAEKMRLSNLDELAGSPYMLGVEGGYYYGEDFNRLIKQTKFQAQINEVIDIEENVQLLLKGHIDGFLVDPVTMKAFVSKYKMQGEFEPHSMSIYSDDIYIMFSKKITNKQTVNSINDAIKKLKENGRIEQIISNWTELQASNF